MSDPTDSLDNSPGAKAPGRSLAKLRAALSAANSDEELQLLIKEVGEDPRIGAQQLADRARRLIQARAAERNRMADLLFLRDELVEGGVRGIAGIDEVGVGPLAGSVVAAAVILPEDFVLEGLNDSKKVPKAAKGRFGVKKS